MNLESMHRWLAKIQFGTKERERVYRKLANFLRRLFPGRGGFLRLAENICCRQCKKYD